MVLDFLFPKTCVGCGKEGKCLCDKCLLELEIVEQVCPGCGKTSGGGWIHKRCTKLTALDGLTAVYSYKDGLVKKMIERIKYEFELELLREWVGRISFETGMGFEMIVPVPLYWLRYNWRGFNQAEEIAQEVGRQNQLVVTEALRRLRNIKQQAKIESKEERRRNVAGAFCVADVDIEDKKILLVDDIFTSGATIEEGGRVLKNRGAKSVWGLVLAR